MEIQQNKCTYIGARQEIKKDSLICLFRYCFSDFCVQNFFSSMPFISEM